MIEQAKLQLIQNQDFNLFDAFKIFDLLGKGSLTIEELQTGLIQSLGLVPSPDEITLFF